MTMPSRRSTSRPTAARRRNVSFLPRPASTSNRVVSVSSNVQLPELPDPRMVIRRLIKSPGGPGTRASPKNNDKEQAERQSRISRTGFSLFSFAFRSRSKKQKLEACPAQTLSQQFPRGPKTVQASEYRQRDAVRVKKIPGDGVYFLSRHCLNRCKHLVQRNETLQVHGL